MAKSKSKLKSLLQGQQSRLSSKQREKEREKEKAAHQNAKAKGRNNKAAATQAPKRPTIPFRPTDTILLIGEGNFSFSRALVGMDLAQVYADTTEPTHVIPSNITATSYDSEAECYEKYADAKEIVNQLRERGVEVVFGVDATKLSAKQLGKRRLYDRVIWNFPHAGKGIADQDRNILSNQVLILGFLRSVSALLQKGVVPRLMTKKNMKVNEDEDDEEAKPRKGPIEEPATYQVARGTVIITLRNVAPYTLWDVPRLAKSPPPPTNSHDRPNPSYILLRSYGFVREAWPGYEHRMTKGERAHGTGTTGKGGEDRSWEFCLRDVDD